MNGKFKDYRLVDQWTAYGWNVFALPDGHDYDQIVDVLETMEKWDPADRRPMIVIGTTTKGYWPGAVNGMFPGGGDQVVGYPSHPYAMKMNPEYFVSLAGTFEKQYGVGSPASAGPGDGSARAAVIQITSTWSCPCSKDGAATGSPTPGRRRRRRETGSHPHRATRDPFLDGRRTSRHTQETQTLTVKNAVSGAEKQARSFRKPGEASARRGSRDRQVAATSPGTACSRSPPTSRSR